MASNDHSNLPSTSGTFMSCSMRLPVHSSRRQSRSQHSFGSHVVFEVAEQGRECSVSPAKLLVRRPVALVALAPKGVVLFLAGAVAGAIAKSLTAPLDRVKILLQVKGGLQQGPVAAAAAQGRLLPALLAIGKQEGIMGYWKGNLPQVMRVIPYSAVQLYSYEVFKKVFGDEDGKLSLPARLAAGACAGMTSTIVTYPLDTLRLRMAVDPSARTMGAATALLMKEGSVAAFFRGINSAMIGIAPYMALELAAFDLLPKDIPSFARGFTAALVATSVCYPLDTIRRFSQMNSVGNLTFQTIVRQIMTQDGVPGFYRGFLPNALKNLPNKGVKLSTFDAAKKLLVTAENAYGEEVALESERRLIQSHPIAELSVHKP